MKNLLFLLLLTFCSCSDDDITDNSLKKLDLEELKQYLPFDLLRNNNSIIYKDLFGNEKKLVIIRESRIDTLSVDGFPYESENHSFVITEQFSFDYHLGIELFGYYTDTMTVVQGLDCFLAAMSGEIPFISIDENGEAEDELRGDRVFGNKSFNDVISSAEISNQQNGFSKFHYNFEFGVVAFEDGSDKLWIFDRYQ